MGQYFLDIQYEHFVLVFKLSAGESVPSGVGEGGERQEGSVHHDLHPVRTR